MITFKCNDDTSYDMVTKTQIKLPTTPQVVGSLSRIELIEEDPDKEFKYVERYTLNKTRNMFVHYYLEYNRYDGVYNLDIKEKYEERYGGDAFESITKVTNDINKFYNRLIKTGHEGFKIVVYR